MRVIPAPKSDDALEMKQMLCRSINPPGDEKLLKTNKLNSLKIDNFRPKSWVNHLRKKSNFSFIYPYILEAKNEPPKNFSFLAKVMGYPREDKALFSLG